MSYTDFETFYGNQCPLNTFLDFLAKNNYTIQDSSNRQIPREKLISDWRESQDLPPLWDENHDEHDICVCGHYYYRHFDTYENMKPVGCKYCRCYIFNSANIDPEHVEKCYLEKRCPFPNCETPPDTFCLPSCNIHEKNYE